MAVLSAEMALRILRLTASALGAGPIVSEVLTMGSAFVQTVHATLGIRDAGFEGAGAGGVVVRRSGSWAKSAGQLP
jgi:hypothetical protein